MPRRRPVMSEALKYEIAAELGVLDLVKQDGWGSVTSRQCGNMVKKAIERAEQTLQNN
jgi:small acid-soluble spore protein F (minor alpha/beta-type SASP)